MAFRASQMWPHRCCERRTKATLSSHVVTAVNALQCPRGLLLLSPEAFRRPARLGGGAAGRVSMDVGREATGEGSSLPGARSAPTSMDWRGPRGGPWPMSKLTVRPGVGAGAAGRGVPGKAGRAGATGVSPWIVWEAPGDSVSGALKVDALAGAASLCMGLGAADRTPPARPTPAAAASPAWPWDGDIRARSCSIHKLACFTHLAWLSWPLTHMQAEVTVLHMQGACGKMHLAPGCYRVSSLLQAKGKRTHTQGDHTQHG